MAPSHYPYGFCADVARLAGVRMIRKLFVNEPEQRPGNAPIQLFAGRNKAGMGCREVIPPEVITINRDIQLDEKRSSISP